MGHRKRLFFWMLITIFIMSAIFAFSAQDADSSSELSEGLLLKIQAMIDLLPDIFGGSDENKIRKYAHLFEYMCLGGSSFMFFKELYLSRKKRLVCTFFSTLVFGLFYACTDEIHQIFSPGRACQLRDIVIDFISIFSAAAMLSVVSALFYKKREHKDE